MKLSWCGWQFSTPTVRLAFTVCLKFDVALGQLFYRNSIRRAICRNPEDQNVFNLAELSCCFSIATKKPRWCPSGLTEYHDTEAKNSCDLYSLSLFHRFNLSLYISLSWLITENWQRLSVFVLKTLHRYFKCCTCLLNTIRIKRNLNSNSTVRLSEFWNLPAKRARILDTRVGLRNSLSPSDP